MRNNAEPNTLEHLTDDELLTLAQEDNNQAFEELMHRNSSSSFKLALSVLRDREEAEDAVQDSYFSAWRHIRQFHRDSKFSTWMTRIVTNHCLMRFRKTRKGNLLHLDDGAPEEGIGRIELPDRRPSPEAEFGNREISGMLDQEIRKLPPLFRSILRMHYFEELSMHDLAQRSGITVAAAKSRLLRARAELKRRVQERQVLRAQVLVTA